MNLRAIAPRWGYLTAIALACVCVSVVPAAAQPKGKAADKNDKAGAPEPKAAPGDSKDSKESKDSKNRKVKTYDFTALDLNGRMRSPQLLYFLERANEELERASLEKRSFIPHMVRSLEEEQL